MIGSRVDGVEVSGRSEGIGIDVTSGYEDCTKLDDRVTYR